MKIILGDGYEVLKIDTFSLLKGYDDKLDKMIDDKLKK